MEWDERITHTCNCKQKQAKFQQKNIFKEIETKEDCQIDCVIANPFKVINNK